MKKLFVFAITLLFAIGAATAADREHTLKIYNWADYIDEDVLVQFQEWYKVQWFTTSSRTRTYATSR